MNFLPVIEEIIVDRTMLAVNKSNSAGTRVINPGEKIKIMQTTKFMIIMQDHGKYVVPKVA